VKDSRYFRQAELMLRAMPHVAAERCFALKGGTTINLFVRDVQWMTAENAKNAKNAEIGWVVFLWALCVPCGWV